MERHGRLLCRAPEAQQIAMSGASGPLRLLIPQGGGPTMLKFCGEAPRPLILQAGMIQHGD